MFYGITNLPCYLPFLHVLHTLRNTIIYAIIRETVIECENAARIITIGNDQLPRLKLPNNSDEICHCSSPFTLPFPLFPPLFLFPFLPNLDYRYAVLETRVAVVQIEVTVPLAFEPVADK